MTNNTTPLLNFTQAAASKVKSLIEEEGNPQLNLRVSVMGGGCSGFQYCFTFDDVINEDDHVIEKDTVKLVVDSMSLQYLMEAEIDYREDDVKLTSEFVIRNPNAKTTCGCGSSFSADSPAS